MQKWPAMIILNVWIAPLTHTNLYYYLLMCTFLLHLTLLICTAHVLISCFSSGSLNCLQGRSASLSSDDVVGLGHEGSRLSQLSLIPRSSTLPCGAPSASRSSQRPTSQRQSSPDSEMVTLEEFLQESNALSPPTVSFFFFTLTMF